MNELISSMSFLMAKHCREMHTSESSYDLMDAETKCDNKDCVFRKTGKCSEGRYEENWKKVFKKDLTNLLKERIVLLTEIEREK